MTISVLRIAHSRCTRARSRALVWSCGASSSSYTVILANPASVDLLGVSTPATTSTPKSSKTLENSSV